MMYTADISTTNTIRIEGTIHFYDLDHLNVKQMQRFIVRYLRDMDLAFNRKPTPIHVKPEEIDDLKYWWQYCEEKKVK